MNSLLFAFLVTSVTSVADSAVLTATPTTCTWDGRTFSEGQEYKPDPCTFCSCHNGRAGCAVADCMAPMCVDAVQQPDQCCAVCPNGSNCRAIDGTIIPAGKAVEIDDQTTCVCPTGGLAFLSGGQAECIAVAK